MKETDPERDIRRRNREIRCRERFETWLLSGESPPLRRFDVVWQYEPCGHDKPPDYLLTLKGQQFAVEITRVPHLEVVADVPLEEESITSAMADIVDAARQECLSRGILSGLYSVHFTVGIPSLRKVKASIVAKLVAYAAETKADYDAPARSISVGAGEVCTIIKAHSAIGDMVLARSIARIDGVSLCEIATRAVTKKARLLDGIDRPSILALPRILLLDADDRPEPPAEWQHCLDNHPSLGDFHSVIVVPGVQPVFPVSLGPLPEVGGC